MNKRHVLLILLIAVTFSFPRFAQSAEEQQPLREERVTIDWDYELNRLDRLMDHLGRVMESPEFGNWLAPDLLNLLHQRVRFLRLFAPNLGRGEYDWPPLDTLTPNVNRTPAPIPKL